MHFGGLVAGFNATTEHLDLADIPFFASGASATTVQWNQVVSGATGSGTLTVADGPSGPSTTITLLGQYSQQSFQVGPTFDGHGGTLVTDPPVATMTDSGPFALVAVHQG
jgi:hypothetical protein